MLFKRLKPFYIFRLICFKTFDCIYNIYIIFLLFLDRIELIREDADNMLRRDPDDNFFVEAYAAYSKVADRMYAENVVTWRKEIRDNVSKNIFYSVSITIVVALTSSGIERRSRCIR